MFFFIFYKNYKTLKDFKLIYLSRNFITLIFSKDINTPNFSKNTAINPNSTQTKSTKIKQPFLRSTSTNNPDNEPQTQYFEELLNKLESERGINADIYCDEKPIIESSNYNDLLYGVHAAEKMSDVVNENIFIEFINSQVKLSLEEDPNKVVNPNSNGNPGTNNKNESKNFKNFKKSSNSQSYESSYESGSQNEYLIISGKYFQENKFFKNIYQL